MASQGCLQLIPLGLNPYSTSGLDYIEVGRQIKVAGSEEATVSDMSVLFFDSGVSRVRLLIANKFMWDGLAD